MLRKEDNIKMKKGLFLLSVATILASPMAVEAAEIHNVGVSVQNVYEDITPYADKIETKYRMKNGLLQYRRWNVTKGCWVDSDWITIG